MKKFTLLLLSMICTLTAFSQTTIYFNRCYQWDGYDTYYVSYNDVDGAQQIAAMTAVENETTVYSATININDGAILNFVIFNDTISNPIDTTKNEGFSADAIYTAATGNYYTNFNIMITSDGIVYSGSWDTYTPATGGDTNPGTGAKTIYLNLDGKWSNTNGEQFSIKYNGNSTQVFMTLVKGTTDVYEATLDEAVTTAQFFCWPSTTTAPVGYDFTFFSSPDDENVADGMNCYTVETADQSYAPKYYGSWSTYTPPVITTLYLDLGELWSNTNGEQFAVEYTLTGSMMATWSNFMTLVPGETDVYEISIEGEVNTLKFGCFASDATTPGSSFTYFTKPDETITDGTNCYTISSVDENFATKFYGTWSAYLPPVVTTDPDGDDDTATDSTIIYLNTGGASLWGQYNVFSVYYKSKNSSTGEYTLMTIVDGETDMYTAIVPLADTDIEYIYFASHASGVTEPAQENEAEYTDWQNSPFTGNLYTITGSTYLGATGEWSTYTPSTGGDGEMGSTTLYLNPGDDTLWGADGNQFTVFYTTGENYKDATYVLMTAVEGEENLYTVTIDRNDIFMVGFYKHGSDVTDFVGDLYSESSDYYYTPLDGNMYTITEYANWMWNGTWSTYTPATGDTPATTFYLNTGGSNLWGISNMQYAISYNNGESDTYAFMTAVEDTTDIYTVTLDIDKEDISYIYFAMFNKDVTSPSQDKEEYYTDYQNSPFTGDQFTITSMNSSTGSSDGTWSTYGTIIEPNKPTVTITLRAKKPAEWTNEMYIHYWGEESSTSPVAMTNDGDDWYSYEFTDFPRTAVNAIFVNGSEWDKGKTQDITEISESTCYTLESPVLDAVHSDDTNKYYNFTATATDCANTPVENVTATDFEIFGNNGHIYINGEGNAQLCIFNITGQVIVNTSFNSNYECQLKKGIYLINLNGKTKKISLY